MIYRSARPICHDRTQKGRDAAERGNGACGAEKTENKVLDCGPAAAVGASRFASHIAMVDGLMWPPSLLMGLQ